MLESANTLKKVMCLMALPMINTSSPSPVPHAVLTFCESNKTVFEVTLSMLDEVCVRMFVCIHTVHSMGDFACMCEPVVSKKALMQTLNHLQESACFLLLPLLFRFCQS